MELNKLSSDYNLDYSIKKGQKFNIKIQDNCDHFEEVCQDTVNSDIKIESLVTFNEGGFFEPWGGFGCYLGTKKSVEDFEKYININ